MTSEPWYRGVASTVAEFEVDEGVVHRVGWRRGRLTLFDHPDWVGDLALLALGGEGCLCLELLLAWRRDLDRFFWRAVGWSRDPLDLRYQLDRIRAELREVPPKGAAGSTGSGTVGGAGPLPRPLPTSHRSARGQARLLVEQLAYASCPGFLDRVAYAIVMHETRSEERQNPPPLPMRELVLEALNRCLRIWHPPGRRVSLELDLWVTDDAVPSIVGLLERHRGLVVAVLPTRWLIAVYARGLAVVDDAFVVDAALENANVGTAQAVHFERSSPSASTPVERTARVERSGDRDWHFTTTSSS